jgi:sugar/nucleoside kinase (ribokinase family)
VFQRDDGRWLAPREASVVDPTGAGDVFAAAFLVAYAEQRDPVAAARFANVTASFSIEGRGITSIPDRAKVLQWLAAHPTF